MAGPLLTPCAHPPQILHVHGLADTTVPYNGGYSSLVRFAFPRVTAVERSILAGYPDAVYYVVTIVGLGHRWPTSTANHYGTDDIGSWLLRRSRK